MKKVMIGLTVVMLFVFATSLIPWTSRVVNVCHIIEKDGLGNVCNEYTRYTTDNYNIYGRYICQFDSYEY